MGIADLVERARARNPLPEGTLAVGAGLIITGLTSYGFLAISARALGPERFSSLSVLWVMTFFVAPGLFLPLEQEVGRALSARRARGLGGRPVVTKAALAGGGLALVIALGAIFASGLLLEHLFDQQTLLVASLVIALVGYSAAHLARGTLSGNGRFRAYGIVVGAEGMVRLFAAIVFALLGIASAGPYGLAFGIAPLFAIALGLWGQKSLLTSGPEASWSELSTALGYLLAGSLLAQGLINAGPLAVKLLADETEQAAAGRFLAGLVIARIPVFLFQAVQAALLPKLSGFAAVGRHVDFRDGLMRLLRVVVVIGVAATVGAFALGPWAVRFLFGEEFGLGRGDLTYLAGASAAFMMAIALAQALIALHGHSRVALAWLVGVAMFLVVMALSSGLLLRVEQGFLAGSIAAALAMAALLVPKLKSAEASAEDLLEAAHEIPIEP